MPPAKFKPALDKSNVELRRAALERLRNRWNLDNEDGEWNPKSEPVITPMLSAVDGGIDHCVSALRAHDDEDAISFLETYDKCSKTDRKHIRIEDIAHASGIGSLRLAEITLTALRLYSDQATEMILSAAMPKVLKATVKAATDSVPIVADTLAGRIVVGHTNGDTKAMEMLLKSRGILPIPKGSQIAIQVNSREKEAPETGHTWKYPEDRLKEIVAVTNPKQLEASHVSTGDPIHFDHNKPMVFER